jgi:hypothetical protein
VRANQHDELPRSDERFVELALHDQPDLAVPARMMLVQRLLGDAVPRGRNRSPVFSFS